MENNVLQNLQTGAVGTEGNYLDYSYWDEITLAHTTPSYTMFATANGQGGKQLYQTDMVVGASSGQGDRLNVGAIKLFYLGHAAYSEAQMILIYNMLFNTTLEFYVLTQDYGKWTLAELLGASFNTIMTPAVAGNNSLESSQAKFHGIFPLNLPIPLPALNTFKVVVTPWVATDAAIDGDRLKVVLAGLLERAGA